MRNEIGEIVVRGNLEPSTFSASRMAVRRRGEAGPLPSPDDAPEVAGQAEGGERRTPATPALARPGAKVVPTCARSSWATPATAVCPWTVRPQGRFPQGRRTPFVGSSEPSQSRELNDLSSLTCQPSSRTGENPSYGMIKGNEETSRDVSSFPFII